MARQATPVEKNEDTSAFIEKLAALIDKRLTDENREEVAGALDREHTGSTVTRDRNCQGTMRLSQTKWRLWLTDTLRMKASTSSCWRSTWNRHGSLVLGLCCREGIGGGLIMRA
jgi:hypothetical protein